jgi:hypothetical protein
MVEILYEPAKQLIIMEAAQYSLQEFTEILGAIIKAGQPFVLNWAEGVVFIRVPLSPTTKDLIKEFLEGRIYWSNVTFALMPQYRPTIKAMGYEIPVINVTPNIIMVEAAKWLKEHANEFK